MFAPKIIQIVYVPTSRENIVVLELAFKMAKAGLFHHVKVYQWIKRGYVCIFS